jgi:hypothetical protein
LCLVDPRKAFVMATRFAGICEPLAFPQSKTRSIAQSGFVSGVKTTDC